MVVVAEKNAVPFQTTPVKGTGTINVNVTAGVRIPLPLISVANEVCATCCDVPTKIVPPANVAGEVPTGSVTLTDLVTAVVGTVWSWQAATTSVPPAETTASQFVAVKTC